MADENSDEQENASDPLTQWEEEVREEAKAGGGIIAPSDPRYWDDNKRVVRLTDKPAALAAPVASDTEAMLNGLIGDCRMLIQEVVLQTARLTPDPDVRLRVLAIAQNLALAAAKVGKTVAVVRAATNKPDVQETRHRMIVEHATLQETPR